MATIDQKSGVFAGLVSDNIPPAGKLTEKPINFVAMQFGEGTPPVPPLPEKEYIIYVNQNANQAVYGYYDTVNRVYVEEAAMGPYANNYGSISFAKDQKNFFMQFTGGITRMYGYAGGAGTQRFEFTHLSSQTLMSCPVDESNPGYLISGPEGGSQATLSYLSFLSDAPYTISRVNQSGTNATWRGKTLEFRNDAGQFIPVISTTGLANGFIYPITALSGASGMVLDDTKGLQFTSGALSGTETWAQNYSKIDGLYYFAFGYNNSTIIIFSYDPDLQVITQVWQGATPLLGGLDSLAFSNGFLLITAEGEMRSYSFSASGLVEVDAISTPDTSGDSTLITGKYTELIYRFRGAGFSRTYECATDGTLSEHGGGIDYSFVNPEVSVMDTWDKPFL